MKSDPGFFFLTLCPGYLPNARYFGTCIIAFLWLFSASSGEAARLFGSLEFQGPITALPQWARVVARTPEELALLNSDIPQKHHAFRAGREWKKMLSEARGLSKQEQLQVLNRKINTWPYQPDKSNYGQSDYWASPLQFLKKSGDCEDFSITKYYALRSLGFPASQLRIVVLKDSIRQVTHAVLAVFLDEKIFILDNLSNLVLQDFRYNHYNPQYSVNEKYRWAHINNSHGY